MAEERWTSITNYEGYYEVSSRGNVRSLDLLIRTSHGRSWMKQGQLLTVSIGTARGGTYRRVQLSKDGKCRPYFVYTLVAREFLPTRPPGSQIRHGPGGQLDDSVENLCYGTPAENQWDRVRDGTDNRGSRNSQAKLTEAAG